MIKVQIQKKEPSHLLRCGSHFLLCLPVVGKTSLLQRRVVRVIRLRGNGRGGSRALILYVKNVANRSS